MLYRELQYVKKKVMLCVACMKNNFDTTFTWQSALAREARVRGLVGVVDTAVAEIVVAILRHFSDNGG
jgi:hypothetical protein